VLLELVLLLGPVVLVVLDVVEPVGSLPLEMLEPGWLVVVEAPADG
jgi:hypothetical protein